MRQLILLLPFSLLFHLEVFGQQEATTENGVKILLWEDGSWEYKEEFNLQKQLKLVQDLEIPKTNSEDVIIEHAAFSLLYNEVFEQAEWVAYELTRQETIKRFDRTDKFLPDPKVATGTAVNKDYKGSGYDRGHLAPAADMSWSKNAIDESFYYSNMSPQVPSFNRGIWKKLEERVRDWAIEYDSLIVITGPVLEAGLKTIGTNKVAVPNYYYKVILDATSSEVKAIGFILPNQASSGNLQQFVVSVDSVESFTGIDFFHMIPDKFEELIEKTYCIDCWSWSITSLSDEVEMIQPAKTEQCKAITPNRIQCAHFTSNTSGLCDTHELQQQHPSSKSLQCTGTTKAGNRCKNKTTNANGKCHLH